MPLSIRPNPVPATGQKYKNIGLPLSVFPSYRLFFRVMLHFQKTTPVPLPGAATPALRRMTHRVIGLSYPFSSFFRA